MKYILIFTLVILFVTPGFLVSQPGDSGNTFIFAKKLFDDKMYDLAAEQFHQFAEQNPGNPKAAEALYFSGLSYFNVKEYQNAKKEFVYLILKFPDAKDLDQAQFKIARCFEAMGDFSAAANAFRQVQVFYPKSNLAEQALFLSAQMFYRDQQYQKVAETLYEFSEIYPTSKLSHDALLLIADSFMQLEKYERTQIEIDKVLATTETGQANARALLMKANLFYRSLQLQQAENVYETLISNYSISRYSNDGEIRNILKEARYFLADVYRKKGMFEKSNENLYKITGYDNNPKTLLLIAENHFSSGAYSWAIDNLKKIVAMPDSTYIIQANFKIGDSFVAIKDYVNAISYYEKAVQLCESIDQGQGPGICGANYVKIADCYLNLNQPGVAISYLKTYRKLMKGSKNNLDVIDYQIAYLYQTQSRDFERALRAYFDFIDNYPQSELIDDAQFGLARTYEENGNKAQSLVEYKNLMNRYPASQFYSTAKDRIEYLTKYNQLQGTAFSNLSGVVQQLAENRMNTAALYQIGLTYFNELKDYRASINLFNTIYNNADDKKNLPEDELLFYRGRAYQLLGGKAGLDSLQKISLLDSANVNYSLLIDRFPASKWADDAAYHQIEIKRQNLEQEESENVALIKEALTSFTYKYIDSPLIDKVNIQLATLMLKKGVNSAVDSLDVHNYLQKIINDFPLSPFRPDARYELGILYYQMNHIELAKSKLGSYVKDFPYHHKTCEAYFQLARIAEAEADYSEAIKALQQIITRYYYSNYADSANLIIGSYFLRQHKLAEALSHYLDIYEKYEMKDDILQKFNLASHFMEDVVFNIATILKTINNKDEAIQFYNKYLIKYPQGKYVDQVLFSLGELFSSSEKGDKSRAKDYFEQLEKNHSSSELLSKSLIKLGDLAFENEKYDEARQYYSKALNTALPDSDQAYTSAQLIICSYRSGQIAAADEKFKIYRKQFRDEKSKQAEIQLEKGDYYLKQKNFEQAEKVFKQVKSGFKNTPEGRRAEFLLGKMYFILNRDEDALEILTDLIKKHPEAKILGEVYLTLGNFYYLQAKQIENALLAYKNAIKQKGISKQNLKIGMHNLVKCYADLQMWDRAIVLSRQFLEKFPLSEGVFEKKIQIGYYYYRLKEYDYAIQLFKKILPEADVDNEPRIQFWIGECYFGKGQFQQAISEYLKIVYFSKPAKLLGQYKVTAQYQAAISYIKLGKLENAKQLFQRIITEQGAESVFGKPAKDKLEEIEQMITKQRQGDL